MAKITVKLEGELKKSQTIASKATLALKMEVVSEGSILEKVEWRVIKVDGTIQEEVKKEEIPVFDVYSISDLESIPLNIDRKTKIYAILKAANKAGDHDSKQVGFEFKPGLVPGEITKVAITDAEIKQVSGVSYLNAKLTAESKDSPIDKVEVEIWDAEDSGISGRYAYESISVNSDSFSTDYSFKFHSSPLHDELIEVRLTAYTKGGAKKELKARLKMGEKITEKYPNEPQPGPDPMPLN
ncbi:MAG: hypothetical protein LWY06_19440 [Firmicutes bacterium]|nr:hypothetical protein [Bacillota bacterium]